jgi:hypothetical protein
MSKKQSEDKLSSLWYVFVSLVFPLITAFLLLLGLNWLLFQVHSWKQINFFINEPSLGTLFTASVALTSLYVAWRKFLYRKQPFVTAKFDNEYDEEGNETICLKLINSGDSSILIKPFQWSFAEIKDNEIFITNGRHASFEADHLPPHESVSVELGTNLVMAQVVSLNIEGADGEEQIISGPKKGRKTIRLGKIPDEYSDLQVDVQKLFDHVQNMDHRVGVSFNLERLREEAVEDLLEKYQSENTVDLNIWHKLKEKYEKYRYGYSVVGGHGDIISNFLFSMAERQRKAFSDSE